MKRIVIYSVAGLAISLGFGLPLHPALGAEQGAKVYFENPEPPPPSEEEIIGRFSLMLERPVHNAKGVLLGTSKDLVVGKSGRLAYLVVERGSAFGLVGPLIPIPWSMVRVKELGKSLMVDLPAQAIRDAPGFSIQKWPDFFSPVTMDKINKYYQPYR